MNGKMLMALKNWTEFNSALHTFDEAQVNELLAFEMKNAPRRTIVLRLHQRANTLRVARERAELMATLK
jgi:hypothetical protein